MSDPKGFFVRCGRMTVKLEGVLWCFEGFVYSLKWSMLVFHVARTWLHLQREGRFLKVGSQLKVNRYVLNIYLAPFLCPPISVSALSHRSKSNEP